MLLLLPCLLLGAVVTLRGYHCDTVQTPIVGIELSTAAGYHRDLIYAVQFDYPLAGREECEYLLEQQLPAAIYVSVDQLDDLQRLSKLHALYPKFVDTEVPTERGEPFTVLLRGMPKVTDSIRLPIHFRYHGARDDDSAFVAVDVTTPTMYMRCTLNNELLDSELLVAAAHDDQQRRDYCLQAAPSLLASTSVEKSASGDCGWQRVKVDYQLKSPLHADIPVGNAKAFPPVLYATIIVSWLVSLWTVFRTHAVPRRINQKLEEQRVLQRKMK